MASGVLEKRPYYLYVIQGNSKVILHASNSKSFKVPIVFWRSVAIVKVLKSLSFTAIGGNSKSFKVPIVFRRLVAIVKVLKSLSFTAIGGSS